MAFSKAPAFDHHSFHQSLWSRALAHPARIYLLTHLLENGPTPFYELSRILPLHRSTVSQHLRLLRQLDLVIVTERYPHTYYAINGKTCAALARRMAGLHAHFADQAT
jgi:DNA-binding transcriptional ArsR family regulator